MVRWVPSVLALLLLALTAQAIHEAGVPAKGSSAALRTVGAWDHPYTITDIHSIAGNIELNGQFTIERVGTKSSMEGDFNGDGLKDIITRGSRGRTYVLFGQNNFQTGSGEYEWFRAAPDTWDNVRAACQAGGGDLASIHSEDDMRKAKEVCMDRLCYLGLERPTTSDPWRWTDGTPVRFTAWQRGQPQNWETKVVYTGSNGNNWHDWLQGQRKFAGICKKSIPAVDIPQTISPSYLNGFNGFQIKGVHPSAIATGDINGDGIDDIILGDQHRRVQRPPPDSCNCLQQAGVVFVILGTTKGFPRELHINWLYGWNGFRVEGFTAWGRFGHSASSGGDINGDGVQDLVVGTFDVDSTAVGSEEVYALFGKSYSQSPEYDLDTWAPSGQSERRGSATGTSFESVFRMYEVFQASAIATPPTGDKYLRGFVLRGVPPSAWNWLGRDRTGYSLSSDGDINNDGVADVVIGSYGASPGDFQKVMAGAVYVVMGKPSSSSFDVEIELQALAYPAGFKIVGGARWDQAGMHVDTSGDINGDGIKDLVIGAPGADHRYLDSADNRYKTRHNVGKVYVVLGDAALGTSKGEMDLDNLALPDGYAIVGSERGNRLGEVFTTVGDINADAKDDVVIGVFRGSFDFKFSMKGGVQVMYGRNSYGAFTNSVIEAKDLHGAEGMTLSGFDLFDMAGQSVSVGDFSGDGKPELLVGVPSHWLIARAFERTGSALLVNIHSTATAPVPATTDSDKNTTLMDYCQCPVGANATTYAICISLEAKELTAAQFESQWSFVATSLSNLLSTGNASVAPTDSAPLGASYQAFDGTEGSLHVHITMVIDGYDAAVVAVAAYDGHGDFEVTVRDQTDMVVDVIGSPGVSSCDRLNMAPPMSVEASGFAITGIEFDWRCMTSGCWVIDIIYTRGHKDSVNTFYLPRTATGDTDDVNAIEDLYNSPMPTQGTYSEEVQATFLPKNFPCGSDDYDPTNPTWKYTGCCIPAFLSKYRPVGEFKDNFLAADFDAKCNSTDLKAGPFSADVFTTPVSATEGIFQDLYLSNFEDSPMVAPGIFAAKIKLDENELLRYAGMIDPSSSLLRRKVNTFVGMANFVPTDYRFLDSSASQIRLTLEKGDFFTVGTSGDVTQTFVDYMYMRLHEIKEDPTWLQYVAVTFTLSADYQINEVTGAVPLASVRVGKGLTSATANWVQACSTNDATAVWEDSTTRQRFTDALAKDCAPAPRFCTNQAAISDSFVSFHIPVGRDYFDTTDDYDAGNKIFVEFVVSVVDMTTNQQATTVMTAEMPLMPGGTSLWCESFEASAELKEIATTDMIVGSAGTQQEMARLNTIANIDSAALAEGLELASYEAASLESGLITLIVKGDSTIFDRDGFKQYSIEMEHILTVHVMETGGITSATVQSLIESGTAFDVKTDEIAQTGYLEPTAALLEVCTFTPKTPTLSDPIPSPCILRRDVDFKKCPSVVQAPCAALEVGPEQTEAAGTYMQTLLGVNDYAKNLGKNYSTLLTNEFSLNGRYNRAWWINPGMVWNPILASNKFALSQQVMVAALVRLKGSYTPGAGSTNRRMLLKSGLRQNTANDYKRGSIGGNILFTEGELGESIRSVMLMSEVLGVEARLISTWKNVVQLTIGQACMSNADLKTNLGEQLTEIWKNGNEIQRLYVSSAAVTLNGVSCGARRNGIKLRAEAGEDSGAIADVEIAIVLKDGTDTISICSIVNSERIVSVKKLYAHEDLKVDSDGCTVEGVDPVDTQFSMFGLSFGVTTALLVMLGLVGICCCVAAIFLCGRCFAGGNEKNKVYPDKLRRASAMVGDRVVYFVRSWSGGREAFGNVGPKKGHLALPVESKYAYTTRVPSPELITVDDGRELHTERLEGEGGPGGVKVQKPQINKPVQPTTAVGHRGAAWAH